MKAPAIVKLPDALPFPWEVEYLWVWFHEVWIGLASNGFGPPRITWEALGWWQRTMQVELDPWEARALVWLGALRGSLMSEKKPETGTKGAPPPPPPSRSQRR